MVRIFCYFILLLMLAGCEAPLDLEGVKQVSQMPVKRFDRFQSIAKHGDVLVVAGFGGTVMVSTDGAKQWTRHELPDAPDLLEVEVCPDGTFAILDSRRKIWISTNGGSSWDVKDIDTQDAVTSLTCGPDDRLWVGGSYTTLLGSSDQGDTWDMTTLDEDAMITDIQFVDEQFGVAVGEFGMVITSNDGGETWELLSNIPNDFYPHAVLFIDRDNGYVVGLNGKVLSTADGGVSWDYQVSGTEAPLYGLARQGDAIIAVGEAGEMLQLSGDQWQRVAHGMPVRSYLRAVLPIDDQSLLIAGGAGALFVVAAQN